MKKTLFLVITLILTTLFVACTPTSPSNQSSVDIAFDVNGGFWHKDELASTKPDATLTISKFNDETSTNLDFTLFKPKDRGLRWHYKVFIQYRADLDVYIVVASDPYTAAIDHLDVPDYDFILGVHYHNSMIASSPTLNALFTDGVGATLVFDQDIKETLTSVTLKIYPKAPDATAYKVKYSDLSTLPTPVKPNFDFSGWYLDDLLIEDTKDIKISAGDTMKTLTAKWESYSLDSLDELLNSLIPAHTTENIQLPSTYSGYTIDWDSSHPLVISTSGKFRPAYEPTTVTLTAEITSLENTKLTRTFNITVPHKKSLAAPIASSYIWRNYYAVDDRFFETLDVINTAFLTADSNGNFSGTSQLDNIKEYIFPKSKIYHNWVVFSVAPESSWSQIARSATSIENFANNIVDIINEHGFDGVDIDWETPRQGEQVWYSNMMKVIYEKVKANNPNHLVTTAITGGQWQPPMYNLKVSNQYIDYINVMTYSMASSAGSYQNALYNRSGFHDPVNRVGQTPTSVSIDASVPIFTAYGVPKSKLIFGLAFYGVRQTRTFNTSTSTWSSWQATSISAHFHDILTLYLNNSQFEQHFDNEAGVPYLLKKDGSEFISYENERSIRLKSEYVIDNELGGLMFWEYGTDTSGTLLAAMRTALNK